MEQEKEKKTYIAPRLCVFGQLVELTATGTAGSSESAGASTMNCFAGFMSHKAC